MGKIESISLRLSNELGVKLNKTKEEIAVLNYGLFIVLHTGIGILLNLFVGIITGMVLEIMTVAITVAMFKRYSGGAHASTPERCAIIGTLFAFILAFVSKKTLYFLDVKYLMILILLVIVFSSYVLYKRCPIPSKNKQFKKESERNRIRKRAFTLLASYSIILIILLVMYSKFDVNIANRLILPILMGITLQMIVITNKGIKIIEILDKSFDIFKQ